MDGPPDSQRRWYRLIIHTDASLSGDIVGIGYTIRVNGRTHKNATFIEGDYTSMDGEFLAMKEAAKVASEFFDAKQQVYFYTDCQALQTKLEDNDCCEKWDRRTEELNDILGSHWSINWIPRERNNRADSLAHTGRRRGTN